MCNWLLRKLYDLLLLSSYNVLCPRQQHQSLDESTTKRLKDIVKHLEGLFSTAHSKVFFFFFTLIFRQVGVFTVSQTHAKTIAPFFPSSIIIFVSY